MIISGEKKEEYRDLTEYWKNRLWVLGYPEEFDAVTFYLGYAKSRPSATFKWDGTVIGEGKEEWGAEKGKDYFVIKLGERI